MISVLMSTYNGKKYIIEQLNSLIQQTTSADEVVICDDCSTDNTVELINEFIQEHELTGKWSVYINEVNLGYKENFKKGIELVKGDYIFFCDQDDVWMPKKIESSLEEFEENQWMQVLGTSVIHFYPDNKERVEGSLDGKLEKVIYNNKKSFMPHPPGCSMAIKREYLRRIVGRYSSSWAHDEFFWRMATVDETCGLLHRSFLRHRMSGTNVTSLKARSLSERLAQAQYNVTNYNELLRYARETNSNKKCVEIVQYFEKGNALRVEFLGKKNVLLFFELIIKYNRIFISNKQLLGDLFYVVKEM